MQKKIKKEPTRRFFFDAPAVEGAIYLFYSGPLFHVRFGKNMREMRSFNINYSTKEGQLVLYEINSVGKGKRKKRK